jgi:hypothetical protein
MYLHVDTASRNNGLAPMMVQAQEGMLAENSVKWADKCLNIVLVRVSLPHLDRLIVAAAPKCFAVRSKRNAADEAAVRSCRPSCIPCTKIPKTKLSITASRNYVGKLNTASGHACHGISMATERSNKWLSKDFV